MSELKVNTISGIAGSVRVNDPVGIGAVAKSGYDLNVDGKVNLEGSVEVITVPASNFGVRIRAPQTATTSPGFGDATLQFTNYAGTTEWASMHAKTDSSLQIRTNNAPALNISSAQVIDHIGQSLFTNKATFNNATQFNGQAIFEQSVIPQCGGTPTVSTHLANKAYVDNISKGSIQFISMANAAVGAVNKSITLKAGTWGVIFTTCVQFPDSKSDGLYSNQTLSSTSKVITLINSHYYTKTGDGGHGRSLEVTSSVASTFTATASSTPYTFSISLPTVGTSRGATALLFYLG
jgi:hypothetical protein